MRFADWRYSRVDLSEVNISRIWKFSKERDYRAVISKKIALCNFVSTILFTMWLLLIRVYFFDIARGVSVIA